MALLGSRAQNPRWRTELIGCHTNFASFHRRTKILVLKYRFSRSRNRMKVLPKPYARYFSWIRRFFAFSAVFKHFSQYFSLMTHVFKIIGPIIRFWGTSNVKKQFPKLFARYFRLIKLFVSNFLRFWSIFHHLKCLMAYKTKILVFLLWFVDNRSSLTPF